MADLKKSRRKIDAANRKIAEDVRERMDAVLEIVEIKDSEDKNIRDSEREKEVKQQFEKLFDDRELPEERGRELADVLIETAVDIQKEEIR